MVPAPDRSAIQWKRKNANNYGLSVTAEQIARSIAADEAFLAAHPVSRRPRKAVSASAT